MRRRGATRLQPGTMPGAALRLRHCGRAASRWLPGRAGARGWQDFAPVGPHHPFPSRGHCHRHGGIERYDTPPPHTHSHSLCCGEELDSLTVSGRPVVVPVSHGRATRVPPRRPFESRRLGCRCTTPRRVEAPWRGSSEPAAVRRQQASRANCFAFRPAPLSSRRSPVVPAAPVQPAALPRVMSGAEVRPERVRCARWQSVECVDGLR